jgi:hypothetical protein
MKKSLFTTVAIAAVLVLSAFEGKGMDFRHRTFDTFRSDYRKLDANVIQNPDLARDMPLWLNFFERILAPVNGRIEVHQLQYRQEDEVRKVFSATWVEYLYGVRRSGRLVCLENFMFPYYFRNRDGLNRALDEFKQDHLFREFPTFVESVCATRDTLNAREVLFTCLEQDVPNLVRKAAKFFRALGELVDDMKDTCGRSGHTS